jgi:hypothetical protein
MVTSITMNGKPGGTSSRQRQMSRVIVVTVRNTDRKAGRSHQHSKGRISPSGKWYRGSWPGPKTRRAYAATSTGAAVVKHGVHTPALSPQSHVMENGTLAARVWLHALHSAMGECYKTMSHFLIVTMSADPFVALLVDGLPQNADGSYVSGNVLDRLQLMRHAGVPGASLFALTMGSALTTNALRTTPAASITVSLKKQRGPAKKKAKK